MKTGIIGTGFIVKEVLPYFKEWGITAQALCATKRSEEKGQELAAEYQVAEVYTDLDEMLAKADIDTVYVAVPNHLHHDMAKKALMAGKSVIVEKPIASNDTETRDLIRAAEEKDVFLFEAVTTLYLQNYAKVRSWLERIGEVRIVTTNYSQYSSRFDAFMEGTVLPAFDPQKSGGALMDINIYNLNYIIGLFGRPQGVSYRANVERGIDTSGIVTLDYEKFQAVAIGAKDCGAPTNNVIQGTKGYILQTSPAGRCEEVTLHLNDGTTETYDAKPAHRMEDEFKAFMRMMENNDKETCFKMLRHSLTVSEVATAARRDAGVVFAADQNERV